MHTDEQRGEPALATLASEAADTTASPAGGVAPVLVFTRTTGYRHESIEAGVRAVVRVAAEDGLSVEHTEDPAAFGQESLAGRAVVVWLSPSGDVLGPGQRDAFARWLRRGGAFAGVHAASTAECGWPEYEAIVGARFERHPEVQRAVVRAEVPDDPSMAGVPALWSHLDEWYDFRSNPRGRVEVLASVDEGTYAGGGMGRDHPVAWRHSYGRGRCWYTALGHRVEAFEDDLFLAHLAGGLRSLWRRPTPG